jgi:SAM-dependent methyltransferase
VTTIQGFNESHIEIFAAPHPVAKTVRVLKEWMGARHRAIDVGCGAGYYADLCLAQGNSVIGIDLTSQVVFARQRGLNVCQGNIEGHLPFPDDTFSLALCSEVIEHLLEPEKMLAEIRRILQPGGILILTTPNYGFWTLRILYLFGHPPVGLPVRHFNGLFRRAADNSAPPWREPHIRFFTPSILQRLLGECGFEVARIRSTFVGFPSALAPYLPWLLGLPLRVIGKLIGNLEYLGDAFPSLLAAGILVKAVKR